MKKFVEVTKKFGETVIETIFPIIALVLTIAVIFFMGGLIYTASNEAKMKEQAEMIFHYNEDDYYIEKILDYSEDQIFAEGVNGKKIIFPKNGTVIEDIKGSNVMGN